MAISCNLGESEKANHPHAWVLQKSLDPKFETLGFQQMHGHWPSRTPSTCSKRRIHGNVLGASTFHREIY